ncbi:hypothetical protein KCP69_11925 [Salmonella enterica subsp. enterica]|nr:hypothetical protein KCP69_11925 [Salmonella enterica subsp. enterica]
MTSGSASVTCSGRQGWKQKGQHSTLPGDMPSRNSLDNAGRKAGEQYHLLAPAKVTILICPTARRVAFYVRYFRYPTTGSSMPRANEIKKVWYC